MDPPASGRPTLAAIYEEMRLAGHFTDFKFFCSGRTIHVHKVIISAGSSIFRGVCAGPTTTLDMSSHELPMVERMVEYLYNKDYTVTVDNDQQSLNDVSLQVHPAMFAIADKYEIEGLADLAQEKYTALLNHEPDIQTFLRSADHVYSLPLTTHFGIRTSVVRFARHRVPALLAMREGQRVFDDFAVKHPAFVKDLLYRMCEKRETVGFTCSCGQRHEFHGGLALNP